MKIKCHTRNPLPQNTRSVYKKVTGLTLQVPSNATETNDNSGVMTLYVFGPVELSSALSGPQSLIDLLMDTLRF